MFFVETFIIIMDNNNSTTVIYETPTTRSIKFWILLFCQPFSILCSVFVLYHMLSSRTQRQLLANQIVIVMLVVSFLSVTIDLSITIDFLHKGFSPIQSTVFCLFWMLIDYVLYAQGMLLMAWASIERHTLVFSIHNLRSKTQLILRHYFPIIFCLIYPFLFYIYTILFYPCKQIIDLKLILCGSPCFKQSSFMFNIYDMLIHSVLPTLITISSSLTLLIRVVRRKRRLQGQMFSWRKQYRMSIQLLTIACLYVLMNFPPFAIIFIQVFILSKTFAIYIYALFIFYLYYFLTLFLPFVCLGSVKDSRKKMKRFIQQMGCYRLFGTSRIDVILDQSINATIGNELALMPTVYVN